MKAPENHKSPKTSQKEFKPGWKRWLNVESDKPVTLPKAPWEKELK